MAIATVLKTVVRKDLQVRILYPPFSRVRLFWCTLMRGARATRMIGTLAVSFALALVANAATPRSLCACSVKQKSAISEMKAELRNLVTAQERFFTDSGRYAASEAELTSTRFLPYSGLQFASFTAWGNGFSARVSYPSRAPTECWITVGPLPDGGVNPYDGEPQCDPPPTPPVNINRIYMAAAYALLLLMAVAVRIYRAGSSLPPMGIGIILAFVVLGALHPFWTGYRTDPSSCTLGASLESMSICVAAVLALWMVVRSKERWDSPQSA